MNTQHDPQHGLVVVGYSRVSSREQADNSQALEQQDARLRDAGATEMMTDVLSGSRNDRPQYQMLMERIRKGEVHEVVVTRIDRLTRSLIDLTKCISIFDEYNVNLKILDQSLDLKTPMGRLMAKLLGAVAEWEVELMSERIRHGKAHKRDKGLACESAPRGYLSNNGKYWLDHTPVLCLLEQRPVHYKTLAKQPDESSALVEHTATDIAQSWIEFFLDAQSTRTTVRRFYEHYFVAPHAQGPELGKLPATPKLYKRERKKQPAEKDDSQGTTPLKESQQVNRAYEILYWTESGLRNWLTNPVLEGNTTYNKWVQKGKRRERSTEPPEVHEDTHLDQALLSHDEAQFIRKTFEIHRQMGKGSFILSRSGEESKYKQYAYLYGLVYCDSCGAKCRNKTAKKGAYHYFSCPHAGKGCNNIKNFSKSDIEDALIRELVRKSQALRRKAAQLTEGPRYAEFMVLNLSSASPQQRREYYLANSLQASDLEGPEASELPTSERLQTWEAELQYYEGAPNHSAGLEKLKAELREKIEVEKQQLTSVLNHTAREIIFSGHQFSFWDTLPEHHKVEIYPRLVDRIFVAHGELKAMNFNIDIDKT